MLSHVTRSTESLTVINTNALPSASTVPLKGPIALLSQGPWGPQLPRLSLTSLSQSMNTNHALDIGQELSLNLGFLLVDPSKWSQ